MLNGQCLMLGVFLSRSSYRILKRLTYRLLRLPHNVNCKLQLVNYSQEFAELTWPNLRPIYFGQLTKTYANFSFTNVSILITDAITHKYHRLQKPRDYLVHI